MRRGPHCAFDAANLRSIAQGLQPPSETAHAARDERDQEQDERDEIHDFGDAHGCARNAPEAKDGGNQRDYQQRNNKAQHLRTPYAGVEPSTRQSQRGSEVHELDQI